MPFFSLYARSAPVAMLALAITACAVPQSGEDDLAASLAGAEKTRQHGWRTEPVIYNGRRYTVSFRNSGDGTWTVKVAAAGRGLGLTRGDGRVVAQIASSTVAHFTCRSARARVRAGSLKPVDGQWHLLVECR